MDVFGEILRALKVNFDRKKLSQTESTQFFEHMALNPVPFRFVWYQIRPISGDLIFSGFQNLTGYYTLYMAIWLV